MPASGLPSSSTVGVLALRLDYLDRERSLSTEYFLAEDHRGTKRLEHVSFWVSSPEAHESTVPLAAGLSVPLLVGMFAPPGWATADEGRRRILVSLLLRGVGPATVVAKLTEETLPPEAQEDLKLLLRGETLSP